MFHVKRGSPDSRRPCGERNRRVEITSLNVSAPGIDTALERQLNRPVLRADMLVELTGQRMMFHVKRGSASLVIE